MSLRSLNDAGLVDTGEANRAERLARSNGLLIGLIVLTGMTLRVYGISALDLWGDEAFSWMQANRSFTNLLVATAQDNYPPLHNIILYFTMALFGDSEIALRIPSALMGTLTIWVVYLVGKKMWDPRAGLIAAVLLAFSPIHIWHSIEARMYALLCLTSILYVWSSFSFLSNDSKPSMLACFLSGVSLLYSHVFGSFVFIAINAAIFANCMFITARVKFGLLKWSLVQFATVVAFLPWLIVLLKHAQSTTHAGELGLGWIPAPTPGYLLQVALQLIGGPFVLGAWLVIGCIGLRLSDFGARGRTADRTLDKPATEKNRIAVMLCAFCVVVPPPIALGISLAYAPIVISRYLISTLPVAFLLAGRFASRAFRDPRALLATIAATLLGIAAILPLIANSGWIRPVTADIASFQRMRNSGDRVLYLGWDAPLFRYYVRDDRGIDFHVSPDIPTDDGKARRIWLVNLSGPDDHQQSEKLKALGYRETYLATSPLILFSLFER
jgi:mannosyltransferase